MSTTGSITVILALLIWSACAYTAGASGEMHIEESARTLQMVTDKGLRLTLDKSNGNALGLAVGNRGWSMDVPLLRFEEVIEDPMAPDILQANGPEAWGLSSAAVDTDVNGHPGDWIVVSGTTDIRPHRKVSIGQTKPQPLVLSGTCQAQVQGDAFGWWNRHLALNANVQYTDGTRMPEVSAYFGQYNHGPQFNKRVICPDRPIQSVDIDLSAPGGQCTAWYQDVQLTPARFVHMIPAGRLQRIDTGVLMAFSREQEGLSGLLTYRPGPHCIEIRCAVQSTRPIDRAISAWVAIPFDAVGGMWHDDVRRSRRIEAGRLYRDEHWYGAGRDGFNSRYPFAYVEDQAGNGLAIATALDEPRVFQTEYDATRRELRIRFDFGLSPDAGSWANRASFTAYLFACSGGFREAAATYYRLFDWAFTKRVAKQGLWLPFLSPRAIAGGHEDFHFQFLESVGNMSWDESQGMYSLAYAEPWIHHHEFPPHVPAPEVHGPVDPRTSVTLANRISQLPSLDSLPLDMRRRYPAYPGSFIEDPWGNPQGYLFRGARNENMMIVNPDERIPPPPGAPFSSGSWDRQIIQDILGVTRQWSLPGWTPARVSEHQYLEIDRTRSASGARSLVLHPVEGRSYWEQHLRGISQIVSGDGSAGPYLFAFTASALDVPADGTRFRWRVTFWYTDGTSHSAVFPLADIGRQWRRRTHPVSSEKPVAFISVTLDSPTWTADSTTLWIDDVSLTRPDGRELLTNGGFEEGELLPCRLDGIYLDTMECYLGNLNYRRAHWAFVDEPLTFDSARRPAAHQVFSHVGYARRLSEWLRPRDLFVFGNCTPATPFAAPWLDVLGNELNWKHGNQWAPWSDSEFNFARFMSGPKPYCLLQYGNLSVEEQTKYIKRCLFYGVLPSNQAAPSGGWYWADPMIVQKHRPVFAQYVPTIIRVAEAGWQPVTLAHTDDADVWIERFGDSKSFYLTIFNAASTPKTATVTIAPEARVFRAVYVLGKGRLAVPKFTVTLDAEDVVVLRVQRR